MVNQNPQPEIYTTRHTFTDGDTQGTNDTRTVFTNQANTEDLRIYSISVQILNTLSAVAVAPALSLGNDVLTDSNDFSVEIQIGSSAVPSQRFHAGTIHGKDNKMLTFPSPILVQYQQPISVVVRWENVNPINIGAAAIPATMVVKVSLHGELSLQPVACHDCGLKHPFNMGCPIEGGAN